MKSSLIILLIIFVSSCEKYEKNTHLITDSTEGFLFDTFSSIKTQLSSEVALPYFDKIVLINDSVFAIPTTFGGHRIHFFSISGMFNEVYHLKQKPFIESLNDLTFSKFDQSLYILDNVKQKIIETTLDLEYKSQINLESSWRYLNVTEKYLILAKSFSTNDDIFLINRTNGSEIILGEIDENKNKSRHLTPGGGLFAKDIIYTLNITEPTYSTYDLSNKIISKWNLKLNDFLCIDPEQVKDIEVNENGVVLQKKELLKIYFNHSRNKSIFVNSRFVILCFETGIKEEYKHYVSFINQETSTSKTYKLKRDESNILYVDDNILITSTDQEQQNPILNIYSIKP